MTKKKKEPDVPPATAERPTKSRQGKHLGIQMPTRLRPEMYAILERLAEAEDRTVAKVGEILVREALRARGLWPPPEPSAE